MLQFGWQIYCLNFHKWFVRTLDSFITVLLTWSFHLRNPMTLQTPGPLIYGVGFCHHSNCPIGNIALCCIQSNVCMTRNTSHWCDSYLQKTSLMQLSRMNSLGTQSYTAKTTARRDEKHLHFGIWCDLYKRFCGICEFIWSIYALIFKVASLALNTSHIHQYHAYIWWDIKCITIGGIIFSGPRWLIHPNINDK